MVDKDQHRSRQSPNVLSSISDRVYRNVLKHAMRMYFYQRAGFKKTAETAGSDWADAASHLGPGQDPQRRTNLREDLLSASLRYCSTRALLAMGGFGMPNKTGNPRSAERYARCFRSGKISDFDEIYRKCHHTCRSGIRGNAFPCQHRRLSTFREL